MFVYLALKFQEIFREVYHSFRYKTVTSDFLFQKFKPKTGSWDKRKAANLHVREARDAFVVFAFKKRRNECVGDFQNKRAQTGSFIHSKGSVLMMSCVFELTSSFT